MAKITVYIAGKDAPTNNTPSQFGHMWYGLTDHNGKTTYYGYHPMGDGTGIAKENFYIVALKNAIPSRKLRSTYRVMPKTCRYWEN